MKQYKQIYIANEDTTGTPHKKQMNVTVIQNDNLSKLFYDFLIFHDQFIKSGAFGHNLYGSALDKKCIDDFIYNELKNCQYEIQGKNYKRNTEENGKRQHY